MRITLAHLRERRGADEDAFTGNATSSANPGSNPLIPQSISSQCQSYLARLNSNTAVSACTSPLVSATKTFSPSAGSSTTEGGSIKTALDGLCATGQSCSDTLIRQVLGHFAGNCSQELSEGNPVVMGSYDVLYALNPVRRPSHDLCRTLSADNVGVSSAQFKKAICTKSALSGEYCLSSIATAASSANSSASSAGSAYNSSSTGGGNSTAGQAVNNAAQNAYVAQTSLADALSTASSQLFFDAGSLGSSMRKRAMRFIGRQYNDASISTDSSAPSSAGPTFMPNSTTYLSTNLLFLFLQPSFPSSVLCQPCTSAILSSYVAFEQSIPYAAGQGLAGSQMLKGQIPLWSGVGQKCGTGFLSGIQKNAGTMALGSGAESNVVKGVGAVLATAALVVGVLVM